MSDPVGAYSGYQVGKEVGKESGSGDESFCLLDLSSEKKASLEKARLNIQHAFSRTVQPYDGFRRVICSQSLPVISKKCRY